MIHTLYVCLLFLKKSLLSFCLDCPGTNSDQAGKSSSCQGCPNQNICASGAAKAPDPGIHGFIYLNIYITLLQLYVSSFILDVLNVKKERKS